MKENLNNVNSHEGKSLFSEASIKTLIATSEIQNVLRQLVDVREKVIIKKVKSSYKNPNNGITTQKVEAVSGTSIKDMVSVNFTLVDAEIDAVKSINKEYRLVDYTFSLDANMKGGQFGGYSATGLKLLVTKIEETEEN